MNSVLAFETVKALILLILPTALIVLNKAESEVDAI